MFFETVRTVRKKKNALRAEIAEIEEDYADARRKADNDETLRVIYGQMAD